MDDADDELQEGLRRTLAENAGGTRAPATDDKPAATAPPLREEHGPEPAATPDRPASEKKPTPAETEANNQRRAQSDPVQQLQQHVAELERRLAESNQRNQALDFDNRILHNSTEMMRAHAADQGAIRLDEMDVAQRNAMIQANAIVEQQRQQQEGVQARQNAWQEAWKREVADREAVGLQARSDAISDILASAIEAGQKLTRKQAEDLITEGYTDEVALSDINLWRDHQTPPELARQRVKIAMKRISELAVQKVITSAVKELRDAEEERPPPNRVQARGGMSAPVSAQPERTMTYEERRRRALEDWSNEAAADLRRLTR